MKNPQDDLRLVKAHMDNLMDYTRCLGGLPGSTILAQEGFMSLCLRIPHSTMNWAINYHLPAGNPEQDVRAIVRFYEALGMPFCLWSLLDPPGETLEKALNANGLKFACRTPCMAADLSVMDDQSPDTPLVARKISCGNDLERWGRTSFKGFELPDEAENDFLSFATSLDINPTSPLIPYIAEVNGEPVGASLLYNGNEVSGIYLVSVLPEQRRKGYGLAITRRLMAESLIEGYTVAILQSSEMGVRVYRKAGFRTICWANIFAFADSDMDG